MRYLLSIYTDESGFGEATPEDLAKMRTAYMAFTDEIEAAGVLRGGDGLQPSSTATTVRVRDGEALVSDGPFTETKEAVGGFYLFDVDSVGEAAELAAQIPAAAHGAIELRAAAQGEAA